jgi:hypothetical protein
MLGHNNLSVAILRLLLKANTMSTKAIASFNNRNTNKSATVRFDVALQEYVVRFFDENQRHITEADYFTSDKDDAIGTAMEYAKVKGGVSLVKQAA